MSAELSFEHVVYYGTREPLPIKDVVESLIGMDKIATTFLADAYSRLLGAEVLTVNALVEGLEEGSFVERFLLRLTFKDEASMDAAADKLRNLAIGAYHKLPGGGYPVIKATVVSGVIAALIATGTVYAINAAQPAGSNPSVSINLQDSPVIVIGAESYNMTPQEFMAIVESVAARDRKKLAENSVKVVAPAKREPGGSSVHIGEGTNIPAMDADIVTQAPAVFSMEPDEISESYDDVDLEIRATDRDSASRGWSGVIPHLTKTRVKLQLADAVDPHHLAGRFTVRANVIVHYRYSTAKKQYIPNLIEVLSLVEESAP